MKEKRAKQILVSIRNAGDWVKKLDECEEQKEALRCIENAQDELHKSIRDMNDKGR